MSGFRQGAYAHTDVDVLTTTTLVVAANPDRVYLLLQNNDAEPVYIKIGGADAVLGEGILMLATGGSYEISASKGNLTTAEINGISNLATSKVLVTEVT